jgi:hypothetical protein
MAVSLSRTLDSRSLVAISSTHSTTSPALLTWYFLATARGYIEVRVISLLVLGATFGFCLRRAFLPSIPDRGVRVIHRATVGSGPVPEQNSVSSFDRPNGLRAHLSKQDSFAASTSISAGGPIPRLSRTTQTNIAATRIESRALRSSSCEARFPTEQGAANPTALDGRWPRFFATEAVITPGKEHPGSCNQTFRDGATRPFEEPLNIGRPEPLVSVWYVPSSFLQSFPRP